MLGFFRKHQKFIFTVVGSVVVITFVFFGTFQTLLQGRQAPPQKIGKLVDGSHLTERDLYSLTQLIKGGVEEGGRSPNLLSNSFLHKEILLGGIGEVVATAFFEEIQSELQEKWERARSFSPYVHPYAPFISAEALWGRFAPAIPETLTEIRSSGEEVTRENLSLLFKLYAAQSEFPPNLLQQMLYYQQVQSQGIQADPTLGQATMALFGFESAEEWFGHRFVQLVAKLILNGACIAEERGHLVSKEEARKSLFLNVAQGLKAFAEGEEITSEQIAEMYHRQLRFYGFTEGLASTLWQKVLVFQEMVSQVGTAVFFDSLSLNQFAQFAKPATELCRYSLPKVLQFDDFWKMLSFQRYIEIVALSDFLSLPKELKSAEEVMKEHPELIAKTYRIALASCTLDEVAAAVSLKKTWDWQIKEENFSHLKREFPALAQCAAESNEERREALGTLGDRARAQVDRFSRLKMVEEAPGLLGAHLSEAEVEERSIQVRMKGGQGPFSGEVFSALLENEDPSLQLYTEDGKRYYRIRLLDKGAPLTLLGFEEVEKDGTILKILDELLFEAYTSFKETASFEEAKEEVARRVYADLLIAIQKEAPEALGDKEGYARHRFDGHLKNMMDLVSSNLESFIAAQRGNWPLSSHTEHVAASIASGQVGAMTPEWGVGFYQILSKEESKASEQEIAEAKESLSIDAKRVWMGQLCEQLSEVVR